MALFVRYHMLELTVPDAVAVHENNYNKGQGPNGHRCGGHRTGRSRQSPPRKRAAQYRGDSPTEKAEHAT